MNRDSGAAFRASPGKIIFLRERAVIMLKKEIILRNPLRILGEKENPLAPGSLGGVIAKAGVGKTAFLVQLALNNLVKGKNVLHISLDEPVRKVCLWHEEVFQNIAKDYHLEVPGEIWESILPQRFIMTFKADDFDAAKVQERINDLIDQDIFFPQLLIIDGLPSSAVNRELISDLKKNVAKELNVPVWLSLRVSQEENMEPGKVPGSLQPIEDLFDILIGLKASQGKIDIMVHKGEEDPSAPTMIIDPSTMLIKQSEA